MCINITPASLYIIYLLYYNLRESEEGGQEEGESRRQRSAAGISCSTPPSATPLRIRAVASLPYEYGAVISLVRW
jgi:hypothetical protein